MSDLRPINCRNRQRDEGKPYPRSGCEQCGDGGLRGCRYDGTRADSKPVPPVDATRVDGQPEVDEVLLSRCYLYTDEQSLGEWGPEEVGKDARKLHDFIRKLHRERIGARDIEAIIVDLEETLPEDGARWRAFGRKFRGLLVSKAG